MVRPLFFAVALGALLATSGCGDDEPSCSVHNLPLSVTVDGRSVATCGSLGWELRVRSCGTGAGCEGACGQCAGDEPIDRACEGHDACAQASVDLPEGDFRVCVEAVLPNGGLQFESCDDVHVSGAGGESVAIAIETGDAFPCIRDWVYDGATCCNDEVGACNPP